MSLLFKWYLRYRHPKYQRAYRLVFNPEGVHQYPNELKAQLSATTRDSVLKSMTATLQKYVAAGKEASARETFKTLAELAFVLPHILETSIQLANWRSLAARDRKHCIALVAYLVNPLDVVPEGAFGSAGFADDVIFASIVFKTLVTDTSEKFVSASWKGDQKSLETLCAIEASAKETLPELHREVTQAFQSAFA